MALRVLVVSNLDSKQPFGQFTRPFFLGRGMAERGIDVANVAPDCARVDFGPAWSTGRQGLRELIGGCRHAIARFRPDVVYAHQNMPACAALLTAADVPVAADCHAFASEEWRLRAKGQPPREAAICRARELKAFAAERYVVRRAGLVVAASAELASMLVERHGARRVVSVTNGVDDRILQSPATAPPAPYAGAGPHLVATLPIASSPANERALAFLRDATEALHARLGAAQVHVLGTEAGPAAPGLRYHGTQDVVPWIDHADACLMPYPPDAVVLGGVRNKLLEYLARGRAIVTTQEGLMGLKEAAGWEGVAVAPDDPAGFADATVGAVAPRAPRLDGRRAQVRERLGWNVLAGEVAAVLAELAGAPGAGAGDGDAR